MENLEGTNLSDFHLMTTFASLSLQYKRLRNKNDVFSGSNCWKGLERFICEMSRCFVIFVKSTSTAVNNCPGLFSVVNSAQFQFSTFTENYFQFPTNPCFEFRESVIRWYEVTAHLHYKLYKTKQKIDMSLPKISYGFFDNISCERIVKYFQYFQKNCTIPTMLGASGCTFWGLRWPSNGKSTFRSRIHCPIQNPALPFFFYGREDETLKIAKDCIYSIFREETFDK